MDIYLRISSLRLISFIFKFLYFRQKTKKDYPKECLCNYLIDINYITTN